MEYSGQININQRGDRLECPVGRADYAGASIDGLTAALMAAGVVAFRGRAHSQAAYGDMTSGAVELTAAELGKPQAGILIRGLTDVCLEVVTPANPAGAPLYLSAFINTVELGPRTT